VQALFLIEGRRGEVSALATSRHSGAARAPRRAAAVEARAELSCRKNLKSSQQRTSHHTHEQVKTRLIGNADGTPRCENPIRSVSATHAPDVNRPLGPLCSREHSKSAGIGSVRVRLPRCNQQGTCADDFRASRRRYHIRSSSGEKCCCSWRACNRNCSSFVFRVLVVADVLDGRPNGAADMHKVRSTIGPFYCKVCMCVPAVTMINFFISEHSDSNIDGL
jgi:hypothetical protein